MIRSSLFYAACGLNGWRLVVQKCFKRASELWLDFICFSSPKPQASEHKFLNLLAAAAFQTSDKKNINNFPLHH
jgi:hypothetical protein